MGEFDAAPARGPVCVDGTAVAALIGALTDSAEQARRIAAELRNVPEVPAEHGAQRADGDVHGERGDVVVDAVHARAARAEQAAGRWSETLAACVRHLGSTVRAVSEADTRTAEALRAGAEPHPGGTVR